HNKPEYLFFFFLYFLSSTLSANAPEFVPFGSSANEQPAYYDDSESYFPDFSLAEMVTEFLGHLSSSPGSFEVDVEHIASILNSCVITEELLKELVELIFTQSTSIPNFSYTGARLCNYLSHHLTYTSPSGSFRQLLLQRCHTEYGKRDAVVGGEPDIQKKFHSFVLFLGELYLHLEVKRYLSFACKILFLNRLSHVKMHLISFLFGRIWQKNINCQCKKYYCILKKINKIKHLRCVLAVSDVRQMLLKLVELRSSDWGRVCAAAAASNATPDNDPNYFMNEPTFYTEDGTPFTAADPEYAEKYQEILERQDYFHDVYGENGSEVYDSEDEMDPEIEEAYENFCLESERKRQQ
uniref:Poly(A) binding protein interacting protein 1 n=1 Tax=Nothobranchius furzeri TaxID=105023 RepID=A0A8C6P4H2_NOTFU